ncbi:GNAT family N-acetyltransferase [Amaricoccus macauensis]|uniref:GNAT family N-acetyltransferase n=1 Tax=Amaricoccus macauensis TaxID=57001 RepID=UPI003C7D3D42
MGLSRHPRPKTPKYRVRLANSPEDLRRAQALRHERFLAGRGAETSPAQGFDADDYDQTAQHVMVEDARDGALVCCYRIRVFESGAEITGSYSAQYYDLSKLALFEGRMLEMGRFCIASDHRDPDILRLAWGYLTEYVARERIDLLFGCSSFHGIETGDYEDAFALLKDKHLAPRRWLPRVKAPSVFRYATRLKLRKPDLRRAMQAMPPLLRSYLMMGGWVSDHAVVDRHLNTLHVFTGLEIRLVPPARLRLLSRAAE